MLPDIDSLALFVKAAELHSLTRAADASLMGVAAASRRISLLEHRLKSTLFDRSPKGVELSAAGETLLVHAKAILLQLNQMQADMDDHAAGRKGQLRVLANTSAMSQFLPDDLARFSRDNPDVRLIVEERWSVNIIGTILAGEADVGIIMDGHSTEGLDIYPYRSDQLAVVVPKDHELARTAEAEFTEVLDHDLIALEHGSSMMRLLADAAVNLGKALHLRVQVRGFDVVCRMVQSRMGVGLLPFRAAQSLSDGMGLEVRPIRDPWSVRSMLVCVKKDRPRTLTLTRFLEALKASG